MTVVDYTHLLDKEEGTAFDADNVMFGEYDEGNIFYYDNAEVRDFATMLDQYGKARTLEQVLTLPIRNARVTLHKGEATTATTKFVEQAMFAPANNGGMSTPLSGVIAQMCGAIVNRKAYFEKVFTERDSRLVYDKLAWRPASTCRVVRTKDTAAFDGFKQQPIRLEDTEEKWIRAQRAFVYIHGQHRSPLDGVSDLTIAHWCWKTSMKIRFLWYSFLEGQSLPKTVIQADDDVAANDAARKMLALRQGGIVAIGKSKDQLTVDAFESSGKGAGQFKEALQWLDSEASNSVLAGFTDLGAAATDGRGSFALSKDQTDFFLMSRAAVAAEMQESLNHYVVPDLVRWNFGPDTKMPTIEFGPIAEDDASMAVTLLSATAQSTSPNLPREFMNELTERVAAFLNLDVNVVRAGIERAAKEAEEAARSLPQTANDPNAPAVAGVAGAVAKATEMVTNPDKQEAATDGSTDRGSADRGRRAGGGNRGVAVGRRS